MATTSLLDKTQLMPLFVKLVGIAGGALVAKGVMTQGDMDTLTSAIPAIVGAIGVLWTLGYSLYANRKAKQIAKVADMPEATGLKVTDPALAAKVDSITSSTTPTVAP